MSGWWVRFRIVLLAALCALVGCTDERVAPSALGVAEPRRLSTPPRVLLIGDSILDQHGSHARVALRDMGVDVTRQGVWGSSLFTRDQYDCGAVQMQPQDDDFAWLHEASKLVERVDPDLVFVYLNHNYLPDYPRTLEQCATPEDDFIELGGPDFERMTGDLLREFLRRLRARQARVVFVSPVPMHEETASTNPIWSAYLKFQDELGFEVVDVSMQLISQTGRRVDSVPDCYGQARRVRPETDNHLTYFGAGLMGTDLARAVARELELDDRGISAPAERPIALLSAGSGYRLVTCDAATFAFGQNVVNAGGGAFSAARPRGNPVVAAAATPSGAGYALLFSTGKVLSFGDAPDFSASGADVLGGITASGIAIAPNGAGYWVTSPDGAVHGLGGAPAFGRLSLSDDSVVGIASLPTAAGYWLVTRRGKIGAFGAACHFGDLSSASLTSEIVGLAAHPQGNGYWLLDGAGRVFAFGQARDFGSAFQAVMRRGAREERVLSSAAAVGIATTPSGAGYHIVLSNGATCHFGDAERAGSVYRTAINGWMMWAGEPVFPADSPCQ